MSLFDRGLQHRLVFDLFFLSFQFLDLLRQFLFLALQVLILLLDHLGVFVLGIRHLDVLQLLFHLSLLWLVLRGDLELLHREGDFQVVLQGAFVF